ncbi:MAG: fumarylacetoacetate hydrolase family protein [Deltaproteobacteria bacterium]|nr:fumarylacetoacetate hydrolase family protein [Deltaproteobacteria bacterium]
MRLARFSAGGKTHSGVIEGERVFEAIGWDVLGCAMTFEEVEVMKGDISWPLSEVHLLPPVLPSKIVAAGLNYRAHAAELGRPIPEEPLLFMKPPTAVIGPGGEIVYPSWMSNRVDYEGELAVVVGKAAKGVGVEAAKDHILGYTCINDVTARDLQAKDVQFTRAKGFDTFAPIGPWIETGLNPLDVKIETYLNGEKRQDTSTTDIIFNVYELLSFISKVMTLLPGDIIATGTPSGIGKMEVGDCVEVRIEGIGSLVNTVKGGNL